MWPKYVITIFLLFIFAILQASFFPQLGFVVGFLNLVFVVFFIVIFFEEKNSYVRGIGISLVAGIMLDIFSPYRFWISIISLLVIYGIVKIFIHFIAETGGTPLLFRFILMYSGAYFFYSELVHILAHFPRITFIVIDNIILQMAMNLVFAIIAFFIYIKFFKQNNRQLTLL